MALISSLAAPRNRCTSRSRERFCAQNEKGLGVKAGGLIGTLCGLAVLATTLPTLHAADLSSPEAGGKTYRIARIKAKHDDTFTPGNGTARCD